MDNIVLTHKKREKGMVVPLLLFPLLLPCPLHKPCFPALSPTVASQLGGDPQTCLYGAVATDSKTPTSDSCSAMAPFVVSYFAVRCTLASWTTAAIAENICARFHLPKCNACKPSCDKSTNGDAPQHHQHRHHYHYHNHNHNHQHKRTKMNGKTKRNGKSDDTWKPGDGIVFHSICIGLICSVSCLFVRAIFFVCLLRNHNHHYTYTLTYTYGLQPTPLHIQTRTHTLQR